MFRTLSLGFSLVVLGVVMMPVGAAALALALLLRVEVRQEFLLPHRAKRAEVRGRIPTHRFSRVDLVTPKTRLGTLSRGGMGVSPRSLVLATVLVDADSHAPDADELTVLVLVGHGCSLLVDADELTVDESTDLADHPLQATHFGENLAKQKQ